MNDEVHANAPSPEVSGAGRLPDEVRESIPQASSESTGRQATTSQPRIAETVEDVPRSTPLSPAIATRVTFPDIPGYEVLEVLGRGGMGVVFMATQLKLKRRVALKMMLSNFYATEAERKRFAREAEVIAGLHHPHIVQVHDVGEVDGCPFFTMELIKGGDLAEHLDGVPQSPQFAASTILPLARAIHHSHLSGIVHRDLKPSNILMDAEETPLISDFGLARRVGPAAEQTVTGVRMGTPSYMSPEMAAGEHNIGPPTDLYSLGAILYDILTGRPPFYGDTPFETERQVIADDPVPPTRLNPRVPRDLQTICLKCLEKSPGSRYATARDLADDVERFQRGEPILARPAGIIAFARRWLRRHRGAAMALGAATAALVIVIAGSLWAAGHFRRVAGEMSKLVVEKSELLQKTERQRQDAEKSAAEQSRLRLQSEGLMRKLRRGFYFSEINRAGQAARPGGGLARVRDLINPWATPQDGLPGWEWHYLSNLCHRERKTVSGPATGVYRLQWSPTADLLATAGADGSVQLWDADGQQVRSMAAHSEVTQDVSWNADGTRLASVGGDGIAAVWDPATGERLFSFAGHHGSIDSVAWSPSGESLATGGHDGKIRIWKLGQPEPEHVLTAHPVAINALAWSTDGKRLVSGGQDAKICIWETSDWTVRRTLEGHRNWVRDLDWSPDGKTLASASNDQQVILWDCDTWEPRTVLRGHTSGVSSVAWSHAGTRLASVGDDLSVKVWSVQEGAESFALRGHIAALTSVAWSRDDRLLASSNYYGEIKIWDPKVGHETRLSGAYDAEPCNIEASPHEDAVLAVAYRDGVLQILDAESGSERCRIVHGDDPAQAIAWNPRRRVIAVGSHGGRIRIYDETTGLVLQEFDPGIPEIWSVAWSPDCERLASSGINGEVKVWPASFTGPPLMLTGHTNASRSVTWSPDGRLVASAGEDATVQVWDASTGVRLLCYRGHSSAVVSAVFSPDGKTIASGGADHQLHWWETATGRLVHPPRRQSSRVARISWQPNGSRLASTGEDGHVFVWDTTAGREAIELASHSKAVTSLAWSRDGLRLFSGGDDHAVHCYDGVPRPVVATSPPKVP